MEPVIFSLDVYGLAGNGQTNPNIRKVKATIRPEQLAFFNQPDPLPLGLHPERRNEVFLELNFNQLQHKLLPQSGVLKFSGSGELLYFSMESYELLDSIADMARSLHRNTFRISGGTGSFEGASGTISTDLQTDSEKGIHFHKFTCVLYPRHRSNDAAQNRVRVRDIIDEKAFPITMNSTMEYAADLLVLTNAHELMVINETGDFVGVVSEYDLLKAIMPDVNEVMQAGGTLSSAFDIFLNKGRDLSSQSIKRLVKSNPITVSPNEELLSVAAIMAKSNIRRIAVVEEGKFVGSVSMADLCWALLSRWNGIFQENVVT